MTETPHCPWCGAEGICVSYATVEDDGRTESIPIRWHCPSRECPVTSTRNSVPGADVPEFTLRRSSRPFPVHAESMADLERDTLDSTREGLDQVFGRRDTPSW